MQTTDPIADFLTRLRNSLAIGQTTLEMPHSKLKEVIAKLLKDRGFIAGYKVVKDGFTTLSVSLQEPGQPLRITALERVSKPGRRVYVRAHEIPRVMGGKGVAIVSTPAGVLDGTTARKRGVGGELICKVW